MRLLGLIFSIVVVVFLTVAPAMAERRLALVVGNSSYRNTPSLANPKNDASAMAEALKRLGFKVIRGIDLSANGMRKTVRKFAAGLQSADVALFYYAGHGLQVNGQNYLVPIDAKMRSSLDLEFEATNLQVVIDLMEREAKTNLVFLDACRDNPLARTLARSLGASRSTTIGHGLARIESGIGTLIAYATEPGNVALDGDGRHSPFTEALLQHIKTPGLEVGRMLRRVRSTVLKKTNGKQVPWEHTSLIGDFYFGPRVATATARPAAPPKPAAPAFDRRQFELAIWESIKRSRKATDFEGFLKQYPNSAFAPGARSRIAELKREKRLAMRPPPPRAKPKPPSVGPGKFFSKAEIREAVVGNTLKFPALRNGKHLRKGDDLFIYFAQNGTVAARARTMPRTAQRVWYFNKSAMLCRTTGRKNKNHCVRIARRDDPYTLELSNPKASFKYEATILKGRQLPEHAPAPPVAAKPNAESPNTQAKAAVRLRDRIAALKAEGPYGDCAIQIHDSRDRDQAAWAECEDRTNTIAALERRMKQERAAPITPQSTAAGRGRTLTKAEIMETVIGNTLNFRHPAFGSNIFIYHGKDGYAFVKGYHPTKTFRKVWFFNKTGMLCRYKVRPQKICLKVARRNDPSKFELTTPHGVSFDATMLTGRQLPD